MYINNKAGTGKGKITYNGGPTSKGLDGRERTGPQPRNRAVTAGGLASTARPTDPVAARGGHFGRGARPL